MCEPTKTPVEIIAEVLRAEGEIHSWRCEYTELYGPCTCIEETAMLIMEALAGTWVQAVPMRELAVDGDLGVWSDEPTTPVEEASGFGMPICCPTPGCMFVYFSGGVCPGCGNPEVASHE
jgi:hypothetical protein